MRALRMVGFDREPEVMEIPEPVPGPGEVVIKVGGAGACHSDLHVLYELDASSVWPMPMTLGHETAGWVHARGAGVEGLADGDPVAVARGISEALNTTIVGLAIAAPSLVAHNHFQRKIEMMSVAMEGIVSDLMAKCYPERR